MKTQMAMGFASQTIRGRELGDPYFADLQFYRSGSRGIARAEGSDRLRGRVWDLRKTLYRSFW